MTSSRPGRRTLGLVFLALVGAAVLAVPSPRPSSPPRARTIRLEARNFEYLPAGVSVGRGDLVTLELVALDVVHGAHIDGYGVELTADPGQTARATFVADRPGFYRIRCSIPCGPLHPFMTGTLRVDPSDTLWRAAGLALLAIAAGAFLATRSGGGMAERPARVARS
jgi:cytochrome c oxidase subunit II